VPKRYNVLLVSVVVADVIEEVAIDAVPVKEPTNVVDVIILLPIVIPEPVES